MLLPPPLENWYLRTLGLRDVTGSLRLPAAVFTAFLAAPYDPAPDFVNPPEWRRREHDHPRYARMCYALARGTRARRVLEIGSSAGGTTTGWARALAEATRSREGREAGEAVRLVCVDDDSYAPHVYPVVTRENVRRVGLADEYVTFERGDSRAVLPRLLAQHARGFDICLVDAGHAYETALGDMEAALPLVRPGGLIAVHDVDPARPMPEATPEHAAPVLDALLSFTRAHALEYCILRFIRKHLGVVAVGAAPGS